MPMANVLQNSVCATILSTFLRRRIATMATINHNGNARDLNTLTACHAWTAQSPFHCRAFPRRDLSQFVQGVRHLQKLRVDEKYCRDSWANGVFAVFYNFRPLLAQSVERQSWGFTWKNADELAETVDDFSAEESVVLNCNISDPGGPPKFAVNIAAPTQPDHSEHIEQALGGSIIGAGRALMIVSKTDRDILFQCLPLLQWHSSHQFCPQCGGRTLKDAAGTKRMCQNCNEIHYPVLHPVAMVLVTNGDQCLVVRQPQFMEGMYSAVSGFCEQGETLEAAVKREVAEEVGLEVDDINVHSSQGWSFPKSSLMIGCHAKLKPGTTDQISLDKAELEDSRWLHRNEVHAILKSGSLPGENLWLPPPLALAHQLLKSWASRTN